MEKGIKEEMKKKVMTMKSKSDGDMKKRDVRIERDMVRIGRGKRRWR